ncbi:MAG: hypothetical protein H7844_07350 [Nitrospirae bacterium YQR-1]
MKIIALLPVKNEAWILPTYLSSIKPVVDEIIAIDDNSTDSSREMLLSAGAVVFDNEEKVKTGWAEHSIRVKLLHYGRQRGGTHFICLDADEAFTGNFAAKIPYYLKMLNPGQKFLMQWLALWKFPFFYRDDTSVWSNNFKDFMFCDDRKSEHDYAFLGVGRTVGKCTPENTIKISPSEGAVFHFQFVPWERFQIKQAWYRCSELIESPKEAVRINSVYAITKDDPNAKLTAVPPDWLDCLDIPENMNNLHGGWYLDEIFNFFETYGIRFFEPLEIWHISELKNEFIKHTGREPKPVTSHNIPTIVKDKLRYELKKVRSIFRKQI